MLHIHSDLRDILTTATAQGDRIASALLIDDPAYVRIGDGNYLAFKADECQLSYRPTNRINTGVSEYSPGHFYPVGRVVGRPGRIVRRFLTGQALEGLTDVDFERFTNNLEFYREDVGTIRVVSGSEIRDWYSVTRYAAGQGTLTTSCMRYGRCQSYFSIYTQNPHVCQMVILTKPDLRGQERLLGRALIWTTVEGAKVLDRVYGTDKTIAHLTKWATDNDIIPRRDIYAHAHLEAGIRVQLKHWRFALYPYLDTLPYLDQKNGILASSHVEMSSQWIATLHGTDGDDFMGETLRYRIPIIRRASHYARRACVAYAIVDGATVRGAQRRLTHRLNSYWQNGFEIDPMDEESRPIVRGMPPLLSGFNDRPLWRKMTDLEMRYFGMQVGTTLDGI